MTHSLTLTAIIAPNLPCMRYRLLSSILELFIQSSTVFCCVLFCTTLLYYNLEMCFGKMKTLKLLREKVASSPGQELGFNLDNKCDYLDHDQISNQRQNNNNNCLSILQINCRGTKSKQEDLEELLELLRLPDLVILSETWLKEGESKFIDIKGYKYEGRHRESKKGGGVGFLIKNKILYKLRPDLQSPIESNSYEHYFIEVKKVVSTM